MGMAVYACDLSEDYKLKASLDYIVRTYQETKQREGREPRTR